MRCYPFCLLDEYLVIESPLQEVTFCAARQAILDSVAFFVIPTVDAVGTFFGGATTAIMTRLVDEVAELLFGEFKGEVALLGTLLIAVLLVSVGILP